MFIYGMETESSLLDFSVVLNRSKKEGTRKHFLKYSFDSVRENDVIFWDFCFFQSVIYFPNEKCSILRSHSKLSAVRLCWHGILCKCCQSA